MGSIEDLERRVATVEAELMVVRQEAAAARALAAGADRDVSDYRTEMRAQTRMISALRETQVEQYIELKGDVAELKAEVVELKLGMAQIPEIKAGITQIVSMLEGLGGDADQR